MKVLSIYILLIVCSCSSLPELQNPSTLNTKSESQSYYYCEHCPEITKLDNQIYQALEPDEPIIESKPIIESLPAITVKRSKQHVKLTKPKSHYRKKYHKSKQFRHKRQCIQWSK